MKCPFKYNITNFHSRDENFLRPERIETEYVPVKKKYISSK